MKKTLIEDHTFTALNEYLLFLSDIPKVFEKIKNRAESNISCDLGSVRPHDTQALTQSASKSEGDWRAIFQLLPALGIMCIQTVDKINNFIKEFYLVMQSFPGSTQDALLKDLDPLRFSPITSGAHAPLNHSDAKEAIDNLNSLLDECSFIANQLEHMLIEYSNTNHLLFARFIDALQTPICPANILFFFSIAGIEKEAHNNYLKKLRNLQVSSRLAGSHLSYICSYLLLFLKNIKVELTLNTLDTPARLVRISLIQINYSLGCLKEVSDTLAMISPR
ncbi:hypothetical protein SB766_11515 [Pseudomonas sp. SIMBA_077]